MTLASVNALDLDQLLREHGQRSAVSAGDARFVAAVMRRVAAEQSALLPADEALRRLQGARPPSLWAGGAAAVGAGLALGAWWWSTPAAAMGAPSSALSLVWGAVAALVAWAWLVPADGDGV
jgi:hypothetical protein